MRTRYHAPPQRQRGIGLIEALIAFLVLCLGLLAVARLQPGLRQHTELARQRSEAVRLAQQDIERLRSFVTLAVGAAPAYDSIADGSEAIEAANGTVYRLTRTVGVGATPQAKQVRVSVAWTGRDGTAQRIELDTLVAGTDPSISATLSFAPRGVAVRGAQARSPQVPLAAKNLGDGSSVFKPVTSGSQALRFDNRSGMVTAQCVVAPARTTQQLELADLDSCVRFAGVLLSGEVRFSESAPLPLTVSVSLDGTDPAIAPWCHSEALETVVIRDAAGLRFAAVPLQATPASIGLVDWQERGEQFVAYHCVVVPASDAAPWSGRVSVIPDGEAVVAGGSDWRACRVTPDLQGGDAIDNALEHAAIPQNAAGALMRPPPIRWNFLMVRESRPCPAGTTAELPQTTLTS